MNKTQLSTYELKGLLRQKQIIAKAKSMGCTINDHDVHAAFMKKESFETILVTIICTVLVFAVGFIMGMLFLMRYAVNLS